MYDNLYIIKKDIIYCGICNRSAPVSIILGFTIKSYENLDYKSIGEKRLILYFNDMMQLLHLKSFKI